MDYYSFLTYTITVSVILLLITYKYAFDKFDNTHCNNFVSNVYLYLALSICIAGLFIHLYTFGHLSSHKLCEKKRFKVRSFHTCVKFDYKHSLKCFDYLFLYINNLVCLCYLLRSLLFCRY